MPPLRMAAAAMADNLMLIADNHHRLQQTVNATVTWCEGVGTEVNVGKTVHVAYYGHIPVNQQQTIHPMYWNTSTCSTEITQTWDPTALLRVLGMYLVPDGSTAQAVMMLSAITMHFAAMVRCKAMTDRIVQYLVSSCLIPAIKYYASGLPLSQKQIMLINCLLMTLMKHGHGVPSMLPNDYFHMRNGTKIPWLEDCLDGRNMEMTLWVLNSQGSQQFAILGFYLQMMTARTHRFFDDDFWKGVGDTNSNFRQNCSNSRMVMHIMDLFFLTAEETVKVKWVGTHGWSRKIANDVGQQQDDCRRDANTPLVNLVHVKEVLREIQHQFGPIIHSNRNRCLPSYRWQYNAQQAARLLRADFIRRPVETRDFRRSALRETFLTPVHTVGMSWMKEITVYMDGSYINTPELLSMSFAVIISYVDHKNNKQEFVAAGQMAEGLFSSTMAELMALALTMALVPKGIPVMISSDSKVVIKLANGLLNKHDV
ncbi:hypothetical protein FBU31_000262 [Coemansia sp. 'formosensis']|nr:hypothetical protein FBU31_000262 [Coemansia sp. 'formosensis']